jgi:hypothetical protein
VVLAQEPSEEAEVLVEDPFAGAVARAVVGVGASESQPKPVSALAAAGKMARDEPGAEGAVVLAEDPFADVAARAVAGVGGSESQPKPVSALAAAGRDGLGVGEGVVLGEDPVADLDARAVAAVEGSESHRKPGTRVRMCHLGAAAQPGDPVAAAQPGDPVAAAQPGDPGEAEDELAEDLVAEVRTRLVVGAEASPSVVLIATSDVATTTEAAAWEATGGACSMSTRREERAAAMLQPVERKKQARKGWRGGAQLDLGKIKGREREGNAGTGGRFS